MKMEVPKNRIPVMKFGKKLETILVLVATGGMITSMLSGNWIAAIWAFCSAMVGCRMRDAIDVMISYEDFFQYIMKHAKEINDNTAQMS